MSGASNDSNRLVFSLEVFRAEIGLAVGGRESIDWEADDANTPGRFSSSYHSGVILIVGGNVNSTR